jgi:hypothetical protein
MKIRYKVHTVAEVEEEQTAKVDGVEMTVKAPVLVVELVSEDPAQKNHLLRIAGADLGAGRKLFEPGARIVGTFSAAK